MDIAQNKCKAFPIFLEEETLFYFHHKTPFGIVTIAAGKNALTRVNFQKQHMTQAIYHKSALLAEACHALDDYFAGAKLKEMPLAPKGTAFQKKVWGTLCTVPYGETKSYKEVAEAIGHHKAYRAVGNANHHNPIMLFIPCHRIISHNGKLGGFGGGSSLKKNLLLLEQGGS